MKWKTYSKQNIACFAALWNWAQTWNFTEDLVLALVPLKNRSHRNFDILIEVLFTQEKVAFKIQ